MSTHEQLEPRISSLETSVATLTNDVNKIAQAVDSLRSIMLQSGKPQWGNLIGAVGIGITVIAAIGASYIAPLTVQLGYHERTLADHLVTHVALQERLRAAEGLILVNGKVADQQIASIDTRLDAAIKKLDDIGEHGSAVTRERLAVLEYQAKLDAANQRRDTSGK